MRPILLLLLLISSTVVAQDYFPNNDDISARSKSTIVIRNATIITQPGKQLDNASLLIKNGKIAAIGSNLSIPTNAIVHDASGTYIYPSFIESYSDFGIQKPKSTSSGFNARQYDEGRKGYYWNDHIRSEQRAIDFYKYDSKKAQKLLASGYGVVQSHLHDGIARGSGMLIALNNKGTNADRLLNDQLGAFYSLSRSSQTAQTYPTSLMGTLALLRQAHFDAQWYKKNSPAQKDRSLEAINATSNQVQYIHAGDKKNVLRVAQMGQRINKKFVIIGGQDAYEMIDDIKKTNSDLIIPVNFPAAYDVSNPHQEWYVNLADMRDWKNAPANPYLLSKHNINYAITSYGLQQPNELINNIKQSINYGLTPDQALAAITTRPAAILGISDLLGSLEKGKLANFIITSGPLFEDGTQIFENWVQGNKHTIKDRHVKNIDGTYTTTIANTNYSIKIANNAQKVQVTADSISLGTTITYDNRWINIVTTQQDPSQKTFTRFLGNINDDKNFHGVAYLPNGNEQSFVATIAEETNKTKSKTKDKQPVKTIQTLTYPNLAYGRAQKPKAESLLYRNATVWTNEEQGILKNTDVLVKNGKIHRIGKNIKADNARVIDATNKHLTSGIIDEHSHIAIDNGVNEAGHNSTAEVSIEDVVDPEDINIYRNLAGGVTTSQLLHGSANPIGGRSAIIKLKWGYSAQDMIYDNTPKFIKFALGENVKQTRFQNGVRFPQTRMGVEQVFDDYFTRAREYEKSKGRSDHRFDEEMEVILEILNGDRFVSCHSYVQSEINMLMKVADRHGFTINTFTHILEGYKLADKMKKHGVGGSTFSDWWAYKYEVNDAIPYNAAIMHSQGVVTAINSDDAEMSRRLNQEAAKAVKYGNVSEEEAWKMVTLNPAKLLHLDHRTGSIQKGKDADLVLWSDHPLSVNATALLTVIDGMVFFDKEEDVRFRESIKKERQQLINEMIAAKNKGLKTQTPKQKVKTQYECDTIEW